MSEKLLRLERLNAVLDARQIPERDRARYLFTTVGKAAQPYWSNLLSGSKSFGSVKARQIEDALGLVPGTLEEHGLPPDASSIAAAFNKLPMDTVAALERRKTVYTSLMAIIQAHAEQPPKSD